MKGYRGTQLRLVQTNMGTHSGTKDSYNQHLSPSWKERQADIVQRKATEPNTAGPYENGSVEQKMKRYMPSTRRLDQQQRMARIEELRELVRTGRYHVDSKSLAQSMLDNETHFTELLQP
ncbi:MAG TPA: hypothetical protein DHW02_11980 [Ktedonobacter sp.]|nr:hypothetical protein [Ktedonobacter sp.]